MLSKIQLLPMEVCREAEEHALSRKLLHGMSMEQVYLAFSALAEDRDRSFR